MMREPLIEAVKKRILLGDGAMGTQLMESGLQMGASGDQWVLTQPEKVRAIHAAYVEAGSELLLTNTFSASALALARHGLSDRTYELNLKAARLARDCIGPTGYVVGDIGPFGGFLEPLGNTSRGELQEAFALQALGLIDGGVDAIIVETMTALEELGVAIAAIRQVDPTMTIVGSVTYDRVADGGFATMTGVKIRDAVDYMTQLGVQILGCNCGTGIHIGDYEQIVARYRELSDKPIMVQPNAGQPRLDRGRIVYDETADRMAVGIPPLIQAGASIIGGCCGTTPEHILRFGQRIFPLRTSETGIP
ncbi:MAG: homocysteine S-methyltransferase family protein [Candidatus Tectomicrobia bacterium]|uniref:Homocysteine S-methyltransferase family protein n=1 Tax=Tectimicrobiota bacterium TaxID=2528274 RepID=A0A932GPL0_UNCTE|nr:homocysteine S-methyltransferase family protein [Candidatus Tectomicrobia bacterium]